MVVADALAAEGPPRLTARAPEWKSAALAAGGMAITFAAPQHRPDLLVIGLIASTIGIVRSPLSGAALIGALLPAFFFDRNLMGPLSVTPPGLALMLTWLAALVRWRKVRLVWPRTTYALPLAMLLLGSLLSLTVTQYPLLSVRALRAEVLEPVLFFLLLLAWPVAPKWALIGFLAGATVTALAAILQAPLGIGGTAVEGVLRVQAWYPSANHLALVLGRALPFLLAAAIGWRRAAWLPAVVVGLALLLTFSTGGWLGAVAAVLVVLLALGYRRATLLIGGGAGLALVLVSGLAVVGRLPERLNPLRQTGGFRLDLWQSSLEMVRDHPLLGVGLDNFVYLYQQFYLREGAAAEPSLSHPHNWVLNFWLSLGLLGLIAFVWLVLRFFQLGRAGSRHWLVAGALGGMADMLVHGFIDNSYFLVDLAFIFWLCLALTESQVSDRRRTPPARDKPVGNTVAAGGTRQSRPEEA
jgi:O-antigen ligase